MVFLPRTLLGMRTFQRPSETRGYRRRVLPVDAEVLPEILQQILADPLVLGGFQELRPECPELVVRDSGESRIRQNPPTNARGLLEIPIFRVVSIEIEKVQKSILVELVLDVPIHYLVKESFGLLLETEGIQESSDGELTSNSRTNLGTGSK